MTATTLPRARGAANGNARLSDEAARAIRATWRAGGQTKAELARRYRVTWDAIDKIIRGATWRHVPDVSWVEGLDG